MSPWLPRVAGPVAFAALFVFLIFLNVLQTLSVVLIPLSKVSFRRFNRLVAWLWWSSCVLCVRAINKGRIIVTGDPILYQENAIIIANHRDMSDILMLMMLAVENKRIGDLKFFVKDVLKFLPGIGWGMLFLDCIFVRRNWDADKDKISRTFAHIKNNGIPFWLISFVEGTRFTEEKKQRSQAFARERNWPQLDNVLMPRTKGFVATVKGLTGSAHAIYDVTIGHVGGVPSLWQIMTSRNNIFHIHVKRILLEELPQEEDELAKWLITRFCEKDIRLEEFKSRGSF